jgi:hypothetical protein
VLFFKPRTGPVPHSLPSICSLLLISCSTNTSPCALSSSAIHLHPLSNSLLFCNLRYSSFHHPSQARSWIQDDCSPYNEVTVLEVRGKTRRVLFPVSMYQHIPAKTKGRSCELGDSHCNHLTERDFFFLRDGIPISPCGARVEDLIS